MLCCAVPCWLQVELYLQDKDVSDLDALDSHLVAFLSLPELRSDMESFRDEIMEYYLQDEGDGQQLEGADGGECGCLYECS